LGDNKPADIAGSFDERLRRDWLLADVGFTVSLDGQVYSPNLFDRPEARRFRLENDKFLCSRESVEVYWNSPKGTINLSKLDEKESNAAQWANTQANSSSYGKYAKDQKPQRSVERQQVQQGVDKQ